MIIKFIKKKIFESLVKDLIQELPELKLKLKNFWVENKKEILAKVKEAVKNAVIKLAQEKGLIK